MTRRRGRSTNILAIIHDVAGKQKANFIRNHFSGYSMYIGDGKGNVSTRSLLNGYLTKEQIFEIRERFLKSEGQINIPYAHIRYNYTPGVYKEPTKKARVIQMLEEGTYSSQEIIARAECTRQHFSQIYRDWSLMQQRRYTEDGLDVDTAEGFDED